MGFFQNSVLNKHLKTLDSVTVKAAYQLFTAYFHNPVIQQNIRTAKEEQFQEGFLRELFVNILGYTLNPNPNFNLTSELKNESGAKKADGAILLNEKALGVIELKGTDTKDLDKINVQAFNYKNNHSGCIYVITSNFEKLRFFIHNSVEHLEFNLFTLTETDFQLLWLCLKVDNLLKGIPLKIKEESLLEEVKITKQLYNDYATFRTDMWQNMVKKNPNVDKLLLFKKTQKLLDRFLFIFFAEDSGLLPPNSISRIVNRWDVLKNEDAYKPLYEIFKQYFGYIDKGRKGHKEIDDIFAYNGGLFQPDELLDNIVIDDVVLHQNVMKLTNYDFQSDVDVNILGHIFENSLNEIENITAEIVGQAVEKSKTKRKRDGVFYTPKYITKYIVENTMGKLCEEKKSELGIRDEDYEKGRISRKKEIVKKLDENLHVYRDWLRNITICDPACGSGAFLNQALEFLLEEHAYIDELFAQLFGASIVFQDESNHILEKNIYGVDINEESVEIAKLSLWLRTAQRGRKLTSLNNNIKCGNSLIDDPEVAGDKAFHWQNEFPAVFHKKNKVGWHITCATHNSRYSQRMFDNHVRLGEAVWLSEKEEEIISHTIAEIVEKDKLNIPAYNICGDHMHILLVCEETELPAIVQKIKSMTARACNIAMGRTIPGTSGTSGTAGTAGTREHAPLSTGATGATGAPEYIGTTRAGEPQEHAPVARGEAQAHLWTQKYGNTEITSEEQLQNTLAYIRNNRIKHKLPEHSGTQAASIAQIVCSSQHAFRTEYKGGFDVVIGNPPYVTRGLPEVMKKAINCKYVTAQYQIDLYVTFIEKGISLLKNISEISFIVPNSWLKNLMMSECRKFILNNINLEDIIPSLENVFPDASVDTMIFVGSKHRNLDMINISEFVDSSIKLKHQINTKRILSNDGFIFDVEVSEKVLPIILKMKKNVISIESLFDISRGINPYDIYTGQAKEIIEVRAYHSDHKKDSTFVPELKGKHTSRYAYGWDNKHYISYGTWLAAPREIKYFEGERIIFREILGKTLVSTLITEDFKIDRSLYIAKLLENKRDMFDIKYVLCILNSTLLAYFFKFSNNEFDNLFPKIRVAEFKKLPVKIITLSAQRSFIVMADLMLSLNKELNDKSQKFQRTLQRKFALEDLPSKLQNWYLLTYAQLIAELGKKKIRLSLSDEAEWEDYFMQESKKALLLKLQIKASDKEIDQMVYNLYELTEDEIKIVEAS